MRLIDGETLEEFFLYENKRLLEMLKSPDCDEETKQYIQSFAPTVEWARKTVHHCATIEAEPVRHGRWIGIEYDGYADGYPVYDLWECSECGEEVSGEDVPQTHPWCHGCGAKMDGE